LSGGVSDGERFLNKVYAAAVDVNLRRCRWLLFMKKITAGFVNEVKIIAGRICKVSIFMQVFSRS
jgi:hypothetical protein